MTAPGLLQRCRQFVAQHGLWQAHDRLLLAFSGGSDSVVLLHLLLEMGLSPALAHMNFGLRGPESDADQQFALDLARQHDLRLHLQRADTRREAEQAGESLQMAARRLRYAWFAELMAQEGYTRLLTAHHQNDHVESLLYSLLRSREFAVLQGVPVAREAVVRPLWFAEKDELLAWARERNLSWREDTSNAETTYLRNLLRHDVLPVLSELNPDLNSHLAERGALAQAQARVLGRWFDALLEGAIRHDGFDQCLELHRLPPELDTEGRQLLVRYWAQQHLNLPAWPAQQAALLLESQAGRRLETPQGCLWRTPEGLRWQTGVLPPMAATPLPREALPVQLPLGEATRVCLDVVAVPPLPGLPPPDGVEYLDADSLQWPLLWRPWQPGDRLQPLGMDGTQLVSDLLTNAHIARPRRDHLPLLADALGPVWVPHARTAHRTRITTSTREVLRLRVEHLQEDV